MSKLNRSRPYMIVVYSSKPARGEKPETKNWSKDGKVDVTETVYFEDKLKDNMLYSAHVIIDILNAKIIKNRYHDSGGTDEEVMKHFVKKYNQKVQEAIASWMRKRGITLNETQIKKIEDNIETPNIISKVLEENSKLEDVDITDKITA